MLGMWVIFLLSLHLLATNFASAGPLFCIWLGRSNELDSTLRSHVGHRLAWLACWAMIVGLVSGGLLYLVSSESLRAAVERMPSRDLWVAASELTFSLICLLLYASCWKTMRRHRWWHASLALLSSSNLLYHFPPLMSVIGKLASQPGWIRADVLDRSVLLPLFLESEVLALTTHFVLASIAVSAIIVLWLISKSDELNLEQAAEAMSRRAAWVAMLVTLLQLPVGAWLLVTLPSAARSAMMGSSALASLAFLGALLLTFMLLQRLLTIAIGSTTSQERRQTGWLMVILVLLMTATLYASRNRRTKLEIGLANIKNSHGVEYSVAAGS